MGDPRLHYFVRRIVVAEGVDQDLTASIELPAENAVRTVGPVECLAAILDRCAEMLGSVLVLEAFDTASLGARKQEANHHVVEAAIDEVVDDHSKLGLPTELFKQGHLRDDPDAM